MADEVREVKTETRQEGNATINRESVSHSTADQPVFKGQQFIYLLYGILAGLLAIRILLSLLGANKSNAFADLIYTITGPFVAPFRGLFGYKVEAGISRFEIETLIAILVYGLFAWLLIKLFELGKKNPEV